jgi:hypothetical protein
MRLKPVRAFTDVSLKGRVPGELHAALTAYTNYYHETIGQPIEVWSLIVQMLQRFVETDREFQTWRRRTQNGSGTEPVTS